VSGRVGAFLQEEFDDLNMAMLSSAHQGCHKHIAFFMRINPSSRINQGSDDLYVTRAGGKREPTSAVSVPKIYINPVSDESLNRRTIAGMSRPPKSSCRSIGAILHRSCQKSETARLSAALAGARLNRSESKDPWQTEGTL
jgi:hypothetical protein